MSDHGRLRVAKLRTICERSLGFGQANVDAESPLVDGAARAAGAHVAVLVGRPTRRSLGPALMWAAKETASSDHGGAGLSRLDLVLDPSLPVGSSAQAERDHADSSDYAALPAGAAENADHTVFGLPPDDHRVVGGHLARIGRLFVPDVRVWLVDGAEVVEVDAVAPPAMVPSPWDQAPDLVELLSDAGLELAGEPGTILGEVAGLEVARITMVDGRAHLDIGVGRFDQELSAVAQSDLPRRQALQRAADLVRLTSTPDNGAHPMTRLARERWLRAELIARPGLVGASALNAEPGLWLRDGLRSVAPAAASGTDQQGSPLVVVCSAGVDTDLVPAALELAEAIDPDARLVLALPGADVLVGTERVAALARRPPRIVGLTPPWGSFTTRR